MSDRIEKENKHNKANLMSPESALKEVFGSVFKTHLEDWLAKRADVYSVNLNAFKPDEKMEEAYAPSTLV